MDSNSSKISYTDVNSAHPLASYPKDEHDLESSLGPSASFPMQETSSFAMAGSCNLDHPGSMAGIRPVEPTSGTNWPQKKPPNQDKPKNGDKKPSKDKNGGKRRRGGNGDKGKIVDVYAFEMLNPLAIIVGIALMALGLGAVGIGGATPATAGVVGTTGHNINSANIFMGGAPDMI